MINDTGTMTGGGGKPRGGRMCLGNAAPRPANTRASAAELAAAEQREAASLQVSFASVLLLLADSLFMDAHSRTCLQSTQIALTARRFVHQWRLWCARLHHS